MKTWLHAFAMCQSMFCAIPFPGKIWDEEARGKMLLCLPWVGLEMGALWVALFWLTGYLHLPAGVRAAILCAYPYLITGFIHLDGFMDVTDAVKSWRDVERRREILKDSHVGSFAVIGCILLILAGFSLFLSEKEGAKAGIFLLVPMVSRGCSVFAVRALKPMHTSQYAGLKQSKAALCYLAAVVLAAAVAGFLLFGKYGFALVAEIAGCVLGISRGYRSLQGMNGDISGYGLTIGELCAVAVYALI